MSNNSPNIAVVVLDTLRYDYFEEYFGWLPGTRFENAWSTSHWTTPAHASLFTGLYASETGVYAGRQQFDTNTPALAESLLRAGYTTRAVSCNVNVTEYFGFDRGFDEFTHVGRHTQQFRHVEDPDLYDWSSVIDADGDAIRYLKGIRDCITSNCDTVRSLYNGLDLKFNISNRLSDDTSDDMGAQRLRSRVANTEFGSAEFLYLNLMEAHEPYQIPDTYREIGDFHDPSNPIGKIDSGNDLDAVRTRYKNAVRYLSDIYRELFAELVESFDYVVTLADHGQLLGEHNQYGHSYGVYPELTHIPLVLYSGETGVVRKSTTASLFDVHRTILELAGIATDAEHSRGRDLRHLDEREQGVLAEYHGLPHPSRTHEALRDWTTSSAEFDAYQEWQRGIALRDRYYGYETIDGFQGTGNAPVDDPEAVLAAAIDSLDVQIDAAQSESSDVSAAVEEDLKHLGYL